jgi:hypothetical protein
MDDTLLRDGSAFPWPKTAASHSTASWTHLDEIVVADSGPLIPPGRSTRSPPWRRCRQRGLHPGSGGRFS